MLLTEQVRARFWAKVDVRGPDECWPWTASVDRDGYGRFTVGGRGVPQVGAHRFAFACENGPIDSSDVIRHACDNPPCCNPGHLSAGTHQDNADDKVARGRAPRMLGAAKLKPADVIEIRRTPGTLKALAQRFGVAKSTISMLRSGKTWGHLKA
ncbi:hypothetical protein ABID82_007125 [Methylobacterium sp. PvP062]|uniref:HNH nuclease domain-containing protein n=1 Tax=Methylobacterium radiotolerans TaxID=31998 RepID=A0ABV2NKZ2_9HYPH|nr:MULTISPECIES: HNH endonuclease signature motif containing protein [unclassified Methylobacterium]KZB99794.1 hypothetical protein AU375_04083 [Methylobacterium radiotolerans]MBP2496096.1 hypothetical protein [Methylobacterium sp. PvP105]MBP2504033.1 hypothetical protein [Methylobacterium sp. PvP109]